LLALWQQVELDFQEDQRHQAFLDASVQTGNLAFAAARYRQASGDHEKKREAERRLAQVTALAFAELDAMKASRTERRRAWGLVAAVVLFGLLALSLLLGARSDFFG
jgi:uncharacterized membrane protein